MTGLNIKEDQAAHPPSANIVIMTASMASLLVFLLSVWQIVEALAEVALLGMGGGGGGLRTRYAPR
jgi:hypothetical protein